MEFKSIVFHHPKPLRQKKNLVAILRIEIDMIKYIDVDTIISVTLYLEMLVGIVLYEYLNIK